MLSFTVIWSMRNVTSTLLVYGLADNMHLFNLIFIHTVYIIFQPQYPTVTPP